MIVMNNIEVKNKFHRGRGSLKREGNTLKIDLNGIQKKKKRLLHLIKLR